MWKSMLDVIVISDILYFRELHTGSNLLLGEEICAFHKQDNCSSKYLLDSEVSVL